LAVGLPQETVAERAGVGVNVVSERDRDPDRMPRFE
jgi:hypothetical protein